ncbi:glycosyltransferase family 47 protein [Nostoc sp. CHAB 5836]|uniref:exostosin domain-containing protein n=1 Tax=Nostoc sp. CHAB 5836 TaxID=2780404 RepID=UPI001E3F1F27|nr:exostosin family protein [Nostoc sp. CHAB 5836]MCC5617141.1 glycosyltransferase family 47 protein [Nostoc sp. CHAB 5836]
MKLNIYSDRNYLPKGMEPVIMLHPFWTEFIPSQKYPWNRLYGNYIENSHSLFQMTSLKEADLVVMPINWRLIRGDSWRSKVNKEAEALSIQFAEKVAHSGKEIIVFFTSDCCTEEIPVKNATVIRTGVYGSKKKEKDIIMPSFTEDFVKEYLGDKISVRHKSDQPVVGFCGLANPDSWEIKLKTFVYHGLMLAKSLELGVSPYKGETLRSNALRILAESPSLVKTNFVIRDKSVFLNTQNIEQRQKTRAEYVKNLVESDYILCCRGSTNYSIRLYEILSCGRIPIFINTDCVLPFDTMIDWKKYCVWIEEKELPYIGEKVAEFHSNISNQEFIDLQYECRNIWKKWLSAEGFYTNLYLHFQKNKTLTQKL